MIMILIIALEEKTNFIRSRVNTNGSESFSHIRLRNVTVTAVIEDHEAIVQVEVSFVCKLDFR